METALSVAGLIKELIEFVWPIHRVEPWERGLIIFFGRWIVEVGPGIYPLVWWLMQMHQVNMQPETVPLGTVETVTNRDGRTITYGANIDLQCIHARLAYLGANGHEEKAKRDAWGVVANTLADLRGDRLDPDGQKSLRRTCLREINAMIGVYGMRANELAFITYVGNMRNMRLFTGV